MTLRAHVKAASAIFLMTVSALSLKADGNKQELDAVVVSVDDHHQVVETHRSYTTGSTTYNGYATGNTTYSGYGTATTNVNVSGTATTNETTHHISGNQDIVGHRVVLQIPDGRMVTVACFSKYALHGDYVNRRSCRVPLTSDVHVEMWKDKAKIYWSASIDNSKTESETYKILGVQPAP